MKKPIHYSENHHNYPLEKPVKSFILKKSKARFENKIFNF